MIFLSSHKRLSAHPVVNNVYMEYTTAGDKTLVIDTACNLEDYSGEQDDMRLGELVRDLNRLQAMAEQKGGCGYAVKVVSS